jgi:hypothetical protein
MIAVSEFVDPTLWPWLLALVGLTAVLYSSVGHGGASGYLAAMALLGVAPAVMKPAALLMNIVVTLLVSVRLYRAGYFRWDVFWPFAVSSVPMAFVGGGVRIADPIYKYVVGVAAYRSRQPVDQEPRSGKSVPAQSMGGDAPGRDSRVCLGSDWRGRGNLPESTAAIHALGNRAHNRRRLGRLYFGQLY